MKKESDEFDYENYPTNLYSSNFSPKDAIASLFKKNPSDATAYKLPDSSPVDYSEKTELVALPSNETPVSWQVAKMLNNYDDLHKKAGQQWDKRVISKKSVNDATKFYYDLADKGGAYIPIAALGATMTEDVYPMWRDMVTDPVNLALSLPSGGAAPALGIIKKGSKIKYPGKDTQVTLYRGLTKKFDPNYDLSKTDAPSGYSTWTDNPKLARQYAGEDGFVYEINLPANKKSDEYINSDGDRALFFNNNKKAGLNGISGDEYLVYNDHELFDPSSIKQSGALKNQEMTYERYSELANGNPALTEDQFNLVNARHAGNADKRNSRRAKSAADRNVRDSFVIPEKNQSQLNQYFEDRRAQEMDLFNRKQGINISKEIK